MQVARDKLISLGSCIGKFTHSSKFRLGIGALDILSQYAKYKVRIMCDILDLSKADEVPREEYHSVFNLRSRDEHTEMNKPNLRALASTTARCHLADAGLAHHITC
jgi:UPF0113 Pre-PUA domain